MPDEIRNDTSVGAPQQYTPITQDQAYETTNVSAASSGVVKDKIENAAIGRGTDGASLTVVNANQPTLPHPDGTASLHQGNAWLDAGNMMQFILIMSEVLKEKLKDSIVEGQLSVATMDSIKETGLASAEAKYNAKIFEAVKMALSAVIEFTGAAMSGAALGERAKLTSDRMTFESKAADSPTHGMDASTRTTYDANQTRIGQLEAQRTGGASGTPGGSPGLSPREQAELTRLQNKQAALRQETRQHQETTINQKIGEIDMRTQMNGQIIRGADSLQQSGMTMASATEQKEADILDMYQNMNNQAIQSSRETHGKIEDDIKAAIDIVQDAVAKNAQAFSFKAA